MGRLWRKEEKEVEKFFNFNVLSTGGGGLGERRGGGKGGRLGGEREVL